MRKSADHNSSQYYMPSGAAAALASLLAFYGLQTQAAGLPDTGQSLCDGGSGTLVACSSANSSDSATYPRQDGRFGRDAKATAGTLAKSGAGAAGFDYTKVANNGSDLAPDAALGNGPADWGCTRDNVTGLTWEMKNTTTGNLHDWGATFSWYSTDDTTNGDGGVPGPGRGTEVPVNEGGNTCHSIGITCNTQAFVAAVNAVALCGFSDWRMPSLRELQTLVDAGASGTFIDQTYFPNTVPLLDGLPKLGGIYWSAGTYLRPPSGLTFAWGVDFQSGGTNIGDKSIDHMARLVRGARF